MLLLLQYNQLHKTLLLPSRGTILVADDSNLVSTFIQKLFDDKYDVVIANDGAKAIEIVNSDISNNIICCLLDLNMPNVNGFEVLEYFDKNNIFDRFPVSVISGANFPLEILKPYPIVEMLCKPFNEKDIGRVIEKSIKRT